MPTLRDALRPLFAGRKVMVTGGPLAALTGMCRRLRELGAQRPFPLATGIGTGDLPGPEEAEWCVVEMRAPERGCGNGSATGAPSPSTGYWRPRGSCPPS